ncbi:MAG: hypothetical protein AB1592_17690 [Pseudomonadota bacterium]
MQQEIISREERIPTDWLRVFNPNMLAPDDATDEELELHVARLECAQGIDGLSASLLEKLLASLGDARERLLNAQVLA